MKNSSKKIIWRVLGIIFALVALGCLILFFLSLRGCEGDIGDIRPSPDTDTKVTLPDDTTDIIPEPEPEPELPLITGELPSEVDAKYDVSFTDMYDINPDIHAWIKIPGTPIDYPVLQSQVSDLYYERKSYTGDYSISGCIFSQYYNSPDFSDRNTVLYGHYMLDGTFFGTLHNYKDPDFF